MSDDFTRGVLAARREYAQAWVDGTGKPIDEVVFTPELMRARLAELRPKDLRIAADRMAAGITIAIAHGLLDTRSRAADALLDYCDGEPMTKARAWEILDDLR